ncbi:MAG: flagellar biosynthesis repressor FlbT [Pseudomonadota bacterium]
MPGLILKLRAHEQILVNGVVMQNGERNTRLIIKTPDAKILRLRDAIHPDEVDTPVKRVCYVAQLLVAGETPAEKAVPELTRGIAQLAEALQGVPTGDALDEARRALAAENFYGCLRHLRQLLPIEADLLGKARNGASPASASATAGLAGQRDLPRRSNAAPAIGRATASPSPTPASVPQSAAPSAPAQASAGGSRRLSARERPMGLRRSGETP